MEPLILDGCSLSVENVEAVARSSRDVVLAAQARQRVAEAAATIRRLAASDSPVYGVNTGVGSLLGRRISPDLAARYSYNQIISQIVGLGDPLSAEAVRAAILVRANTLSQGLSGVRPETIELLLEMLNRQITPVVPGQGSLGSSGDLAPLSHIAIVGFAGPNGEGDSGQALFGGRVMSGAEAMAAAGLERLVLGPKEGLALTNGDSLCAGMLALCVIDAERLVLVAELAAAASLEALLGVSAAFDERLHQARRHPQGRFGSRRPSDD